MEAIYPFLVAFTLVLVSELGDKTQLLVLSFSTKVKARTIMLGVALGSFFSHGIAILFGGALGNIENATFHRALDIITYGSFIVFGILTFLPGKDKKEENKNIFNIGSYVLIIALSIAIGELGDKTFLASIGLGIQYYNYKISLVIGAILGMIVSDSIAILCGKSLGKKIPEKTIKKISGILFLIFGIIGLIS